MVRDCRPYFRRVTGRLLKRYVREVSTLNSLRETAEQRGDNMLERMLYLFQTFNRAEMPNGTKLAPSIQQEEFDWKVIISFLPLLYGSAYKVRFIRERIQKRLGVGDSHKVVMIQMQRQCGKSTEMTKQIAVVACTGPFIQLVTGHKVEIGKKMVEGVIDMYRVLAKYATDIKLPDLDTRHESVNHAYFLWGNGTKSSVIRITAAPNR